MKPIEYDVAFLFYEEMVGGPLQEKVIANLISGRLLVPLFQVEDYLVAHREKLTEGL